MNKSILILSFLFFASCAKDSGSSTPAAAAPVQTYTCSGSIAGRIWKVNDRTVTRYYNMYSSCDGTIPHCQATFKYDIKNSDATGNKGLMKIWVYGSSEDQSQACPAANTYSECDFEIAPHPTFGYEQLKLNCNNFITWFVPTGAL